MLRDTFRRLHQVTRAGVNVPASFTSSHSTIKSSFKKLVNSSRLFSSESDSVLLCEYDNERAIATLTIHRPKALNALNTDVIIKLRDEYKRIEKDDNIRAICLTGSKKAFAAGADIKEMLGMDYFEMRDHDRDESLLQMSYIKCSKPIVAAVNGFAFGGGCELAMGCDIIIAGENAQFAQPEINLGMYIYICIYVYVNLCVRICIYM